MVTAGKLREILTKLTTYKGRLTSRRTFFTNVIANLAFKNTVLQLLNLIKEQSITLTTYLDDLTFSSKIDFRYLHIRNIRNYKKE